MDKPKSKWAGLLPFIGVILFVLDAAWKIVQHAPNLKHELVLSGVTYMIGWAGLGAGIAHIFFGKKISRSIGFEQSPYELEVGFCDLGFGIVGLMAASHPPEFWLAIIWFSSLYRIGCGIGHIKEIVKNKNYAVNNTGILFINFIVPAFLLFAYYSWL
jgi:hypothetical protein